MIWEIVGTLAMAGVAFACWTIAARGLKARRRARGIATIGGSVAIFTIVGVLALWADDPTTESPVEVFLNLAYVFILAISGVVVAGVAALAWYIAERTWRRHTVDSPAGPPRRP